MHQRLAHLAFLDDIAPVVEFDGRDPGRIGITLGFRHELLGIGEAGNIRRRNRVEGRKIKLTGLAPASLIRKYIESGAAQDIWWNVKDLGYLTYYAAQALAQCKLDGKPGSAFTAGRLGEYKVGDGGEVVLGPAKIVTPANVGEFAF